MIQISDIDPQQGAILFAVGGIILALVWFAAKAIVGHILAELLLSRHIRKLRTEPRFENGYWVAPDGVKFTLESMARDYCKRYFG